jgi:hypothetical protein
VNPLPRRSVPNTVPHAAVLSSVGLSDILPETTVARTLAFRGSLCVHVRCVPMALSARIRPLPQGACRRRVTGRNFRRGACVSTAVNAPAMWRRQCLPLCNSACPPIPLH